MANPYADLVPAPSSDGYADLIPQTESTTHGGPRIQLPTAAASREGISEAAPELAMAGKAVARGGKTLLAAMADLATLYPGGNEPSVENLRAYADNPEGQLPVEQGLAEMRGIGSIPTKAAAGLIRAVPAIGASMGLASMGAPAAVAGAVPLSANEQGQVDPTGVAIGAVLPGVTAAGEKAVAAALSKLPMKEVAVVLSRDPLRIKGKVIQKFGPIDLSNDIYRQWLETGGGAVAANAFLLATQVPEIASLPPEDRTEAIVDFIAGNIGPSLIGFGARRPMSQTLERMAPDIMGKIRGLGAEPAPKGNPYSDLIQHGQPTAADAQTEPAPPRAPAPAPVEPTEAPEPVSAIPKKPLRPKAGQIQTDSGLGDMPEASAEPSIIDQYISGRTPARQGTPETPASEPAPETAGVVAPADNKNEGGDSRGQESSQESSQEEVLKAPAAPEPAPEAPNLGGEAIANFTRNALGEGKPVTRAEVVKMGAELGLSEKDSEEWAELGSTEAARTIAQDGTMTTREKFASLVALYDRMPRAVTRTTESRIAQQYSTPPPLAWVGSVLADFRGNAEGLSIDPTGGHGMLLIGAAKPWANELDPKRRQRLQRFLGKAVPGGYDATSPEFLDVVRRMAPARIGMNPPFGSLLDAQGNNIQFPIHNAVTKAKTTPSIDIAIALNTLDAMPADGKAFVILGAKTGSPYGGTFGTDKQRAADYRRPVMMEFFERFVVADWFTIGGDLYRKMGAAWPVDVLIIHGKGKTPASAAGGTARPWMKPPRVIETWDELAQLLPANEVDNIKFNPPAAPGNGGQQTGGSVIRDNPTPGRPGKPKTPAARPERPPAGGGGGNPTVPTERPAPTPSAPPVVPGDSGAGIGQGTPQTPGPVAQPGAPESKPGPAPVGGTRPVAPPTSKTRQPEVKPSVPVEGLPASLMVPYQGASRGPSLNLVAPRNIATQMLEAQRALESEVGMPIDQFLADRLGMPLEALHKSLAGAQVDAAALAIRNIERGRALITADETGVGKGRVVAAIIQYSIRTGRVPIFVTAKKGLYSDMVSRDLVALGNSTMVPFITDGQFYYVDGAGREVKGKGGSAARVAQMEDIVKTGTLPGGASAIFTTFDQLKADRPRGFKETPKEKFARKKNRVERPDGPRWAMIRALAPRAIIIMDEAHLAAGKESELNLKFASILPKAAGSYFSSATFAKRPDNLGLYALGTSMKLAGLDAEQLTEALTKGGVPMQQALTSMLASSGELVRRQQDWTGVEFRFPPTSSDPTSEVAAADSYTQFIRDLMQLAKLINGAAKAIEDGENQVRPEESTVDVEPITFGSRLFNLSNQYLLALRAEAVVKAAIAELKAGRKPFIALYNTMEGPILDLKARKLPVSFNGVLIREMQKMLTMTVHDPLADGGKRIVELQPEDLPDGGAYFRALESQILATDLTKFPISPIDFIRRGLETAGYKVGELTARDGEVDDTGEEVVITKRETQERNKILAAYNDGALDVLIVNGSGSTGLSAHTDPRFKDQRQRSMLVAQPAPDINEFMQMIGRVMRSGQTSKPVYKVMTTALAAERRFATMLRGKMTSLNANTTAEGESGMTQTEGFAADVFNTVGDKVAFEVMRANPDLAQMIEVTVFGEEAEAFEGFARFATGRFVLLPNKDAQRLWDEIIREFVAELERLDEAGQNPLRAAAEDLRAKTIETTTLADGAGQSPFDGPAMLEKAVVKPPKAPPKHAEAVQQAQANRQTIREAARQWLEGSKAAEEERVKAAYERGMTPDQVDSIRSQFQKTRNELSEAFRMIGETWGVDLLGDGTSAIYGVAVDIKLAGNSVSDFASPSRQQLVLRTNTYKGKMTIPLSKLFPDSNAELLRSVADEEAEQKFDSTAETSSERYIVTGNLLRGWEQADMATSGREGGRPRVAIYTRDDGSLATGILMPPGWTPGAAAASAQISTPEEFIGKAVNRVPMRSLPLSSVHPVVVAEQTVSVPAAMTARRLWGNPAYAGFFREAPVQQGGQFVGRLKTTPQDLAALYQFLMENGIRLASGSDTADLRVNARGGFVTGVQGAPGSLPQPLQVRYGGMQHVRPLEMPELVRLARSLAGASPRVRKMRGKAIGQFSDGMITLDARIFASPYEAARVLAHELGHLVDYLPDQFLSRGNLLGHLHALRRFMRQRFGAGTVTAKELKTELMALTMWWRPYNPQTDPPSYVKYRQSPEELYADALSVLFNAPDQVEARAPKFYAEFWNAVDKRPEVRDAIFGIQETLTKGRLAVIAEREAGIEVAFAEGERRWKSAVEQRRLAAQTFDGFWTQLWQGLYWEFYPLERLAKQVEKRGVDLPLERDPRNFLDDLGYRDVTVMRWGRRVWEKVIQPLEAAGLTLEDAGTLMFYERILNGDRAGLANPGGIDPAAAQLGLLKMNLDLGLAQMTLLRDAVRRFRSMVFELTREAVEVGAYNRSTFKNVIEPNKDSYATFAVLDYLEDYIPAGIKAQMGTLKDVANPFQATVLKSIGLIHLIAWQRAKNLTVDFMNSYFPGELTPTQNGKPAKGKGIFRRLENGRIVEYDADLYIADAFEKVTPGQLWRGVKFLESAFRKIVYPFIITYNIPFLWVMSPLRDLRRTALNSPDKALPTIRLLRDYAGQIRTAGRRYMGIADPLVREMEANLGVGTPFDQLARVNRDDFMADLLKRMRVLPDDSQKGIFAASVFRPVRALLDGIEFGGLTLDFLAKVAAYKRMRRSGRRPREAAVWIRNYAGLPNINKKGKWTAGLRAVFPFINVAVQAWRADAKVMFSPKTAPAWWLKWALSDGFLKALMAASAAGLLGSIIKELMDGIGSYDKENYLVIPLGKGASKEFTHRTVYLRIPQPEHSRLVSGMIYRALAAMGGEPSANSVFADMMDFGMGQLPGVNPLLSVPVAWSQAAAGIRPTDPGTGRDIIPERQWDAGGAEAAKALGSWTLDELGMLNWVRYDPQAATTTQLITSAVPGVSKFVKTSDQGFREAQRAQMQEEESQRARAKLQLPALVQGLEWEYWHLARLPARMRTPQQSERLETLSTWYRSIYAPAWEAIETNIKEGRPGANDGIRRALERESRGFHRNAALVLP